MLSFQLNDIEDKKESEEKEKDDKDLNLTSNFETNTVIAEDADSEEMSSEIAVKEEAEGNEDADVIKTEISLEMLE